MKKYGVSPAGGNAGEGRWMATGGKWKAFAKNDYYNSLKKPMLPEQRYDCF
jgi:hypothetical protein